LTTEQRTTITKRSEKISRPSIYCDKVSSALNRSS